MLKLLRITKNHKSIQDNVLKEAIQQRLNALVKDDVTDMNSQNIASMVTNDNLDLKFYMHDTSNSQTSG